MQIANFFRDTGIKLDTPIERKKGIIRENQGKIALIKDLHYPDDKFFLARIKPDPLDERYYIAISYSDEKEKNKKSIILNYHDLEQLIVENH
ncbi:hypothetical protein J4225_03390 [Candidatus Pacearchaeota archaeon]|nr:hypothetical protein [Candidatus Pacearchaeota archaeon]